MYNIIVNVKIFQKAFTFTGIENTVLFKILGGLIKTMKKVITVLMIMIMTISLVACGTEKETPVDEPVDNTVVDVVEGQSDDVEDTAKAEVKTAVTVFDPEAMHEFYNSKGYRTVGEGILPVEGSFTRHDVEEFCEKDIYMTRTGIGTKDNMTADYNSVSFVYYTESNFEDGWPRKDLVASIMTDVYDSSNDSQYICVSVYTNKTEINFDEKFRCELDENGYITKASGVNWAVENDFANMKALVAACDEYMTSSGQGLTMNDFVNIDSLIAAITAYNAR